MLEKHHGVCTQLEGRMTDVIARILKKSERDDNGCLVWTGHKSPSGYGVVGHNNKVYRVHRLIYAAMRGDIPDGMCVCHYCDNRACF